MTFLPRGAFSVLKYPFLLWSTLFCCEVPFSVLKYPFLFWSTLFCYEAPFSVMKHPFLFWSTLFCFEVLFYVVKYPFLFWNNLSIIKYPFLFWSTLFITKYPGFNEVPQYTNLSHEVPYKRAYWYPDGTLISKRLYQNNIHISTFSKTLLLPFIVYIHHICGRISIWQ